MITLTPTPARVAGLTEVDTTEPRIKTRTAIGVITAGYLLFFGLGGLYAIYIAWNDIVLPATDYSAFGGFYEMCGRLIGIGGAVMILYVVTRWLQVDRALTGLPKYRAPAQPALFTIGIAIAGQALATMVLSLLQSGPDPDPNAAGGGVESNPWAILGLVSDLNAGVVEEIIIVAIPVLVGRRAGWHPAWIIGLSMLLRWPFHIYHGAFASLPWAMIWGGANVIAFLYLRRLLPLIMLHFLIDANVDMGSAYGGTGQLIVALVGVGCVAYLLWRTITDQRRRLNPKVPTLAEESTARRYLREQRSRTEKITTAVGVAIIGALVLAFFVVLFIGADLWAAIGVTAGMIVMLGFGWWAGSSAYNATNVITRRDEDGTITGVIRWHTTYTGRSALDSVTDGIDILDAIEEIARHDHQPVTLSTGDKTRKARLTMAGLYPTTGRRPQWICVPANQAESLNASPPADEWPANDVTFNLRPEE